jgi:hypothetical protein
LSPGFNSHTDGFDDGPQDDAEIIDEEELYKLKQIKDLKRDYRNLYK